MKKKFFFLPFILLVAIMSASMISCGSDDDDNSSSNNLSGTKWTVTAYGDKYILEFTSANQFSFYEADVNNNYVGSLETGAYSYSNGKITFTDSFSIDILLTFYYAKEATISGNIMTVVTEGIRVKNISSGGEQEDLGEKTFTFMKVN